MAVSVDSTDELAAIEALVEQTPAIMYVAGSVAARPLRRISPAFSQALGYDSRDRVPLGELWRRHLHPQDHDRVYGACARALAGEGRLVTEYRILDCAGRERWFHDEMTILHNAAGAATLLHGFIVDITENREMEARLRSNTHDLRERVKELSCLYSISYLSEEGTVESILERVVGILPAAWQYPKRAWARIEFEGRTFKTDNIAVSRWQQAADIVVEGRPVGRVVVGYLDAEEDEGDPFLVEERALIEAIARRLADVIERRTLEREVIEIAAREQSRVGQDLHDSLGQLLTGIACLTSGLAKRLEEIGLPEAAEAAEITDLVRHANSETRFLARGLMPVELDARGLVSALHELAYDTENLFNVACLFCCDDPVLIEDAHTALHLYRITQEATNNAIKHGKASRIDIRLAADEGLAALAIADDGGGFAPEPAKPAGMGLRIMRFRAQMIGGTIEIAPNEPHGTVVTCRFPHPDNVTEGSHET